MIHLCKFLPVLLLFAACQKKDFVPAPLSSLTIANAAIDVASSKFNYLGEAFPWLANTQNVLPIGNSKQFALPPGSFQLQVVNTADTTQSILNEPFTSVGGEQYTLLLSGQAPHFSRVLIKENLQFYTDSVVAVRVINLSPNSPPLKFNLASNVSNGIVPDVHYNTYSEFVQLPFPKVVPSGALTFQVRNASTNALLASYTLPATASATYPNVSVNKVRFKNLSIVIKGLVGTTSGTNAFGLFPILHSF